MCTAIICRDGTDNSDRWTIGFNRDEKLDRPSRPPELDGDCLYPVDEVSNGTWLGVNRASLIIGILNRRGRTHSPASSRGSLVLRLLKKFRTADEVLCELVSTDDLMKFNPATIFACGLDGGFAMDLRTRRAQILDQDVSVITERGFDCSSARARYICATLPSNHGEPVRMNRLISVLAEHSSTRHRWYRTCCHGTDFGTVSSQIIVQNARGLPEIWHAEGLPCVAEHKKYGFN
jgi:hypothetical protein